MPVTALSALLLRRDRDGAESHDSYGSRAVAGVQSLRRGLQIQPSWFFGVWHVSLKERAHVRSDPIKQKRGWESMRRRHSGISRLGFSGNYARERD